MQFSAPLIPATLVRRYKRFLADCVLEDGREVVAHVANPGSMLGLAEPGLRIWLEPNDDPRRKLGHTWRLVEHPDGSLTGVDTGAPNRLVRAALAAGAVPGLDGFQTVRPEVPCGTRSRIDFLLTSPVRADTYVEVKSVTLSRQPGLAEFPDSVTARGARHLDDLADIVRSGGRAVMLYVVQRSGVQMVTLARDLDPRYAERFAAAARAEVEVLCLGTDLSPSGIALAGPLPFVAPRTKG